MEEEKMSETVEVDHPHEVALREAMFAYLMKASEHKRAETPPCC
jgi:hypothetical protein